MLEGAKYWFHELEIQILFSFLARSHWANMELVIEWHKIHVDGMNIVNANIDFFLKDMSKYRTYQ